MNYSKQREQILKTVRENLVHPDAKYIYSIVKEVNPNISLATVYRNLNLLADMGEILRLKVPDSGDRYDATTQKHYHIFCNKCQKVEDVDLEYLDFLNEEISKNTDFKEISHELIIRGICKDCQKE